MSEPDKILVVCSRLGNVYYSFDDNLYGKCLTCQANIYWRPHSPEPSDKICLQCYIESTVKADEVGISQQTKDELTSMGFKVPDNVPVLAIPIPRSSNSGGVGAEPSTSDERSEEPE